MPYAALIGSLEQKVEKELAQLRDRLEEKLGAAEEESRRRLTERITRERQRRMREAAEENLSLLRVARARASVSREQARSRLLKQLWVHAVEQLPTLREKQGPRLLHQLALELPDGPAWSCIRVHPDDAAAAGELFPKAKIILDEGLSGGLVAEAETPPMQVDNSLLTRLRRCWPQLSVTLLAELEEHGTHLAQAAD